MSSAGITFIKRNQQLVALLFQRLISQHYSKRHRINISCFIIKTVSHCSLDLITSRYNNLSTDFQFLSWLLNDIVSRLIVISQNDVALFSQLEPFSPRLVCVYYQNDDVAPTSSSTSRYISNQQKFEKFMWKNNSKTNSFDSIKNNSTTSSDFKCYQCGRYDHYVAACKRPKQDTKRQLDHNNKDIKDKKFYRKRRDRKFMVAEENWYQSKELSKANPVPPVFLQTTAEFDDNLTEKGSVNSNIEAVTRQISQSPKRKLILAEDSDSEDTKPLKKSTQVLELVAPTIPTLTPKEARAVSKDKVEPGHSDQGNECAHRISSEDFPEDKEKWILVEVTKGNPVKEIIDLIFADIETYYKLGFCRSVSIVIALWFGQLKSMKIVSTIEANVAKLLRWAEMDSFKVSFKWRFLVQAKFRELLLRKLLVERQKKFFHDTSFTNIDIIVFVGSVFTDRNLNFD
ncbi:hypothetical protein F511_34837 [Dorcoceras hygrometricum]|uniref:CCHC-type domain-containing protein n=1 Tax=Dorcoceras hygrometricum TaxID=472368 RepID=A0A2Z7BH83_9LAMI|nr:hypothetical protein F511_34837 [Dorcoceras hygrometricum]